MSCSALVRRVSNCLLIVACIFTFLPAIAAATSASISVSGNEGALPLDASAEFTKHKFCNGASPPDCWYDNSGTLTVSQKHPNGGTYYMGSRSGKGSADWSTTLDTGAMAQGTYTFVATACDSKSICSSSSQSITIDNTPEVTASVNKTEGDLDIKGTVDFKEYVGGNEGRVELYYIHPNGGRYFFGRKYYEGSASINWSWKEIVGSIPDAGAWAQGKYTIQAIAIAANGTSKQVDLPITIDNTPEVNIVGPRCFADLTCDILGTVTFKEYANGAEGTVTLYLKEVGATGSYSSYGSKSYEGTSINWKYSDFTGARMSKATWGGKELMVQVIATAANGTKATAQQPLMIPAFGCPLTLK